ncbi:ABC-three component system protein [Mucilaginibacter jinjuensis]|uniref:ABC-three component systems C-terminal domain-containing protein n=1 Tax=Mucilaginibacter jinjuensis TaxID=1176721 RepID=A0ABY7T763_9SPHI|nr:ABC-three component system protein [Mucilaginibacter jinjuensis]WCT12335.1 hypothetical protein PQO05_00110 [Mucilaginibacter jinjuensis]
MQLSREEKYIARKLFQLEIHKRSAQAFEDFFVRIMQLSHPEFIPVKPQGQYGDRKNDGFIKSEGKYYQVYAPYDPATREKETIDKLVADFKGLYSYWNSQVVRVKEYYFVLNDKYQGAYASLHPELTKIENENEGVKCFPLLAQHLEDKFLALPPKHIEEFFGPIIEPEQVELFDVSVMNEVIKHLLSSTATKQSENFPENPDFNLKIVFNRLSEIPANYLRFGSFQEGELKNYFKINSTFAKEDLRTVFNNLYKKALLEMPDSDDKSDLAFFYIMNNAHPTKNFMINNAVLVLMAYFFSYCDIFEEPIKQQTLF